MDKPAGIKLIDWQRVLIAAIVVLVPFHALLTVWAGSNFGGYTAWRLWDEGVLIVLCGLAMCVLWWKRTLWQKLKKMHVVWLIGAYVILELLIGFVALARRDVNAKALIYGLIIDLRFVLFFLVCLLAASQTTWLREHWRGLLLIPAVIVVGFGLAQQFILPADFLSHFGYSLHTIPAYETVNQSKQLIRLQSTLRGPNPLGAYLVIVIGLLCTLLLRVNSAKQRLGYSVLLASSLVVLFFSYSRSAWVAAIITAIIILGLGLKTRRQRTSFLAIIGALVLVGVVAGVLFLRHDAHFQNVIFHTSPHSAAATSSDQDHLSALKQGINDVVHQPLGRGPGTSGPASVYNNRSPRSPENYFLEIAQGTGWLGLALFVLINWLVGKELWRQRQDPLALSLLATLIGISVINIVLPAWTDDTLGYIWWGMAGITLAPVLRVRKQTVVKQ